MTSVAAKLPEEPPVQKTKAPEPPWQHGQEWANALTHGIGIAITLAAGGYLIQLSAGTTVGLLVACVVYVLATLGTYFFSTLSHTIQRQPLLNTLRAWDQAMIYLMIAGTYTPLTMRFASEPTRTLLLLSMWAAAGFGFLSKVAIRHRVNATGTISYLLLGYLPALLLASHVPLEIGVWMLIGGLVYTFGVVFLIHDSKLRYLHAAWHVMVIIASACHYWGMLEVVRA